jgi:RNA polymerase sigma-70 factor (ECF subfamily)
MEAMTTVSEENASGPMGFDEFYLTTKDAVLRAVIAATGDQHDAEDCTAEAFARSFHLWDRVQVHPAPSAWVVRTAVNLHVDRIRRGQRTLRLLPQLAGEPTTAAPELPIDVALMDGLRALPDRQREVVAYRVLLGLSGEETARELGISIGTVGTHLHRALAALRPLVSRTECEVLS